MEKLQSNWVEMIESIAVHRDVRARYFKPTCVVAVCALIDRGVAPINAIPAVEVVQEFDSLVSNVFPKKSGHGWMPMWHLMRDGAWVCKKNGVPTGREVFKLTKPKSKKEMLKEVDTIDCSNRFGALWDEAISRDQLRSMMCALLLTDQDEDANLMGEYLSAIKAFGSSEPDLLEELGLALDQPLVVENYARYRVHTRVERSAKIAKEVKRLQGYGCLACGFDFEKSYGSLGLDYIEAHHVVPVSENKGREKRVNLLKDFVVLCSNCHRMIHRLGEPWTRDRLNDLRAILSNTKEGKI